MKTIKYFVLVVVLLGLVVGLLGVGDLTATINNPPTVQASNKEICRSDKMRERGDFVQGVLFAQEVIINMRNNEVQRATLDRKDILGGLKCVTVVVDDVPPCAGKYGLTRQLLQTDTELRLRTHGIKVLTDEEVEEDLANDILERKKRRETIVVKALSLAESFAQKDSDEHFFQRLRQLMQDYLQESCEPPPYLSINVTTTVSEESHRAAFSIRLGLRDAVYVRRNGRLRVAAIWETSGVAGCSSSDLKEYVRECLRDYLDEFINAYLAANPKNRSSQSEP